MDITIDKAINRLIEMSATGGLTGTYENKVISLNFKVDETYVMDIDEDAYRLSYITEVHASPVEVRMNKSDIIDVKHYAVGEFEPCTCCEVIQFFFTDGNELTFFEDVR